MRSPLSVFLILGLLLAPLFALTPMDLRVDGMSAPLGVDSSFPVFSWRHRDEGSRGARQTAYQLQVATSLALLEAGRGDLLDSGKVSSSAQAGISYAGKPLPSFSTAYWRLRVWDGNDRPGEWSEPASWTMGALSPADWKASWISDS
jgi:alpha-L-rhamnosidase